MHFGKANDFKSCGKRRTTHEGVPVSGRGGWGVFVVGVGKLCIYGNVQRCCLENHASFFPGCV